MLPLLAASALSSCGPTPYTEPETYIKHSSPDVSSLYNKPAEPQPTLASNLGAALLSGLFSSSPDADDHFGEDRYHSRKEKKAFTRKNKQSIQASLRNKQ